jgi:TatD DNase family protein
MKYFDAHCHIQFDGYEEDRDAVIAKMQDEAVGGLVVGVNYESSKNAIALAKQHEHLYASVGLHPNDAGIELFEKDAFEQLTDNVNVVAIGECGLDYFRPGDPEAAKLTQREVFQRHIDLATKTGKPLMIHARPKKGSQDAYEDALDMLERTKLDHPSLRGNFHFFVGNATTAKRITDLNFTISYTAVLTFARDYDEVVRSIPLHHLLSETDSPYVAPLSRRGDRNDPLATKDVVAAIASIRGEEEEVVRAALVENAKDLFKI